MDSAKNKNKNVIKVTQHKSIYISKKKKKKKEIKSKMCNRIKSAKQIRCAKTIRCAKQYTGA